MKEDARRDVVLTGGTKQADQKPQQHHARGQPDGIKVGWIASHHVTKHRGPLITKEKVHPCRDKEGADDRCATRNKSSSTDDETEEYACRDCGCQQAKVSDLEPELIAPDLPQKPRPCNNDDYGCRLGTQKRRP